MDPRAEERLQKLLAEASSFVDANGQMGPRPDGRLRELLAEAGSLIPTNDGRLILDEGPDQTHLWGDRVGFLRLGVGLASGALRPPRTAYGVDDAVDTDVGLLLSDDPRAPFIFRWAPDRNKIHIALDAKGIMRLRENERLGNLRAEPSPLIPDDGSKLLFDPGPDEACVWGNRIGFLRFGIGLASGALRPPKTAYGVDDAVDMDVNLLLSDDPRAPFFIRWARDWTEVEGVVRRKQLQSERKAVILFGVVIAIIYMYLYRLLA